MYVLHDRLAATRLLLDDVSACCKSSVGTGAGDVSGLTEFT